MNPNFERKFFLSKETLDTVNSASWFFVDAFWMLGLPEWCHAMVVPTVLTGLCLLYVEKRRPVIAINLAINFWIWMNTLWMLADTQKDPDLLIGARTCFGFGVVCIGVAILLSPNYKETFSHFRRFRSLKIR